MDGRKIGEHGGCYLFANDGQGVNWNEAKEFCEANGGYLADIMDQETQDFIAKTSGNFPEATWWIGGNDFNKVPNKSFSEIIYAILLFDVQKHQTKCHMTTLPSYHINMPKTSK